MTTIKLNVEHVAAICHEAVREYEKKIGLTRPDWVNTSSAQQRGTMAQAQFYLDDPKAQEGDWHDGWFRTQTKAGWKNKDKDGRLVKVKSEDRKEDPLCVPFAQLPMEVQGKERLFRAVVEALRSLT